MDLFLLQPPTSIRSSPPSHPSLVHLLRARQPALRPSAGDGVVHESLAPLRNSLGSDSDRNVQGGILTASLVDRHSLANLLKSAGSVQGSSKDNAPLPSWSPSRQASPSGRCLLDASDAAKRPPTGRGEGSCVTQPVADAQPKAPCSQASATNTDPSCRDDPLALASVRLASPRRHNGSSRVPSPEAASSRLVEASPALLTLSSSQPSTSHTANSLCLVPSNERPRSSSPVLDRPLALRFSSGPPCQPAVSISAGSSAKRKGKRTLHPSVASGNKGKGRGASSAAPHEVDPSDRVLVPDSDDSPAGSPRPRRLFEDEFEKLPEFYPGLELEDFAGPDGPGRIFVRPPNVPHLSRGLESRSLTPVSSPGDISLPAPLPTGNSNSVTEAEKRNQLIRELGFDEEAGAFSSSPIQVIHPTTAKKSIMKTRPMPRKRPQLQIISDDEVIPVQQGSSAHADSPVSLSETDQLRHIGIVVPDSPSPGIAPLMHTWPKAKREVFLKMAGVLSGPTRGQKRKLSSDEDDDEEGAILAQQVIQGEEWAKLLVRTKNPSLSSTSKTKKTWANRPFWKRKGRGGGGSRSRTNSSKSKNVGKVTVVKGRK